MGELGILRDGSVEALVAEDAGTQGPRVAAEEDEDAPRRRAVDGGLAEVGDFVLGDAAPVLPALAHVAGDAQHAEAGVGAARPVGGLARQQEAAVGQRQQAAAADPGVLGGVPPDGVGQGREPPRRRPGTAVVAGAHPEGLPRPRDPALAVHPLALGGDQLVARGVQEQAAVGQGVQAAVHDAAPGVGGQQGRLAPGAAVVGGAAGQDLEERVLVVVVAEVGGALEADQQVPAGGARHRGGEGVHAGLVVDRDSIGDPPAHGCIPRITVSA